jgi:hypothetical protein
VIPPLTLLLRTMMMIMTITRMMVRMMTRMRTMTRMQLVCVQPAHRASPTGRRGVHHVRVKVGVGIQRPGLLRAAS